MPAKAAREAVKVAGLVTLTFRDERTCKAVAAALAVDNPKAGVKQEVSGRTLTLWARAASARSIRETVDDWIRCAAAAEAAAEKGGDARS